MNILVTGGAGYIGTHIAVSLLENGHEVIIADNLYNSDAEAVKRIETITGKQVKFYEVDICDSDELEKIFKENRIESVIHLAGYKAVGESVEKPLKYYRNNMLSTIALLETMEKYSVNNIVFSSSATVYGDPETVPVKEDAKTECFNPYGRTKLFIEEMLKDAAIANKELSVVILRYFNPIGAHPSGLIGEDPQGIPLNLMPYIAQVTVGKREKLSVYGNDYATPDGTGVRDYLHVVDLAKGHMRAIEYAAENKGTVAVNLGSGRGSSVLEIIHAYEKANNLKIPYEIAERRAGDIAENYCDPSLAKELFGWETELSLEEMCRDTYNWQNKNPDGYK